MTLVYEAESYAILGACFEVYKDKGGGFLEAVYQECLAIELTLRQVPYQAQHPLTLTYKGHPLRSNYVPDFICYSKIILELKAVAHLADEHRAQVHNYLRATQMKLGFLLNFGSSTKLEYERIVR